MASSEYRDFLVSRQLEQSAGTDIYMRMIDPGDFFLRLYTDRPLKTIKSAITELLISSVRVSYMPVRAER